MADEDEIDLDEDEVEETASQEGRGKDVLAVGAYGNGNDYITIDEKEPAEAETASRSTTKKELLQMRLRALKMKANQSRQLNRAQVQSEGERLSSLEARQRHAKSVSRQDKTRRREEWKEMNRKATQHTDAGEDKEKLLLAQQASDSLREISKRERKQERDKYRVDDFHNPEGQARNYERNLRSIPRSDPMEHDSTVFDPIEAVADDDDRREREGAKRLAEELKRRRDKSKKSKKEDFEAADVSYINQRNKRFNEKIGRTFDAHTAEIRQNLERGTAL